MSDERSTDSVQIPAWFLARVVPRIREMAELQVMLAFFRKLSGASEPGDPVSEATLLDDEGLREALRLDGAVRPPDEIIRRGIELAVARESLLEFSVGTPDTVESRWLMLATPENRIKLERYRTGELPAPIRPDSDTGPGTVRRTRPGVFKLYEQNIGLVTPIIADRLVEAMELYPEQWIEDAIASAVSYNRRNWRYVQRILETWATEGRSNEANRRYQSDTGEPDPERHLSGEYAAIFRRRRRE
jgi:DNA replication protein